MERRSTRPRIQTGAVQVISSSAASEEPSQCVALDVQWTRFRRRGLRVELPPLEIRIKVNAAEFDRAYTNVRVNFEQSAAACIARVLLS